jgi:hypothetical protein
MSMTSDACRISIRLLQDRDEHRFVADEHDAHRGRPVAREHRSTFHGGFGSHVGAHRIESERDHRHVG